MTDETMYTETEVTELMRNFAEQKETTQSFFTRVVLNEDTTKTGNLTELELGNSQLPVRTLLELSLICKDVCEDEVFSKIFKDMSEIESASSLSRNGFLLRQVGTKRSEVADVTDKPKREPRGFFKKRNENVSTY